MSNNTKKLPKCEECGKLAYSGKTLCPTCARLKKHDGRWKVPPGSRRVVADSTKGHFCIKCGREGLPVEDMGMLGCCHECHRKSDQIHIAAYYRFYMTAISPEGARSDDPWLDIRMAKLLNIFKQRGYVFQIGQKLRENRTIIRTARTTPRGDEFVQVPEFKF